MGICLDTDASAAPDTEEGNESWHHQIENRNGSRANFSGQTITQPRSSVDIGNVGKIKFDPPKVPVIFVLGGPGSGKVTHCDTFMQERRGVTHINMMDLLQQYALGNDMQDFSKLSSKTVAEVLMLEMKMAPAAKAYLISGYPRSMRDVVEYSEKIQVVNGVIVISWRQAILQKQIDYGAKLGHVVLSLAKMELENFFKNVMPVADYFDQSDMLIAVNGERAPSEVYKDFRSAVLDVLSALENQEAMLNGVTGMGRGIHDIPGSIVSVETAPSQQPPHIADMPNITTFNNVNHNHNNNNNNQHDNNNIATIHTPTEMTLSNHEPNNQYVVAEADEHDEQNLQDNPVVTRQPVLNNFAPSMDARSNRIPPIIWVIGGPGSNKATLCLKAVGLNSGWGHISVGRILRAITDSAPRANTENYAIKDALAAGEMAPERSVNNLLDINIRQLSEKAGIIIDGYPRDLQQVKYFENKYKQLPPIILLDCSKLQLGRGRIDDSVSSFRRRLEVFRELTLPMLKAMDNSKRLQIIDGDTDSPSVQREFEKIIRSHIRHIQRLAHGFANGSINMVDPYVASDNPNSNADNMDAILQDLENNDSDAIKTISHHVSLMNGHLKNRNNSGNNNFNDNQKPMMNGDITGGNFRYMLQEAERYPVDSYI